MDNGNLVGDSILFSLGVRFGARNFAIGGLVIDPFDPGRGN